MRIVCTCIADAKFTVTLAAALLLAACQSNPPTNAIASPALPDSVNPEKIGIITDPRLPEISGLAASNLDENTLWAINDSGHDPLLFAINKNGSLRAEYHLGIENRDWESLTSFHLNGEALLLVADSGDNLAVHDSYRLYLFEEPTGASQQGATQNDPLLPLASITFRYPNGPRNCEAVAVSETDSQIVLITKQQGEREVNTLPLQLESPKAIQVASYQGNLAQIPQSLTELLAGQLADVDLSQVTGMEIDARGNAYLLTYRGVYQWTKKSDMTWGSSFARLPVVLVKHTLAQAEAIAYSKLTGELFYTSEKLPAPIWRFLPDLM